MVRGSPRICIITTVQPVSAATAALSVAPRAVTSFQIVAPAATAARATSGFIVSILIGPAQRARSPVITGRTRAISSAALTGAAPGRVLSPPMSRMSAPCLTSVRP